MSATPKERSLAELVPASVRVPHEVRVSDVTLDSRSVRAGALFLACQGTARHGLEFAAQAIDRGARAILYEIEEGSAGAHAAQALSASVRAATESGAVFIAPVPRLAAEAGTIADRFFESPSRSLAVAGFTGTNGKTTCAYLTAQALTRLGRRSGYLGTLGCGVPGSIAAFDLTTPDAVTVHRQLAALRALGAQCVAMEVSSHALAQGRVNGVRFRAAAFTNLTRDHLDFHGSMAAYGDAKARLFECDLGARIINIDDGFGRELVRRFEKAPGRLILTARAPAERGTGGSGPRARAEHLLARDVRLEPDGLRFTVASSDGEVGISAPLLGDFNVENLLTVIGVLVALDVPLERAAAVLGECQAPPGRMEIVRGGANDPLAIVDYAHTPDGLAKALHAARAHCRGALRVVFGCGGDRDRGKRAPMGRIAHELADEVTVTDDNPRTEDAGQIVADILEGIEGGGRDDARSGPTRDDRAMASTVHVQHDRAAAIREALARSAASDVVLIAGKGHEDYQIVGRERRPFSDQAIASAFFSDRRGRP